MTNRYNVGSVEVSIGNGDRILVEDLDIQVVPNEIMVRTSQLDEARKHTIGPPKFHVDFNIIPSNLNEQQVWFHEFNNIAFVGGHLAKNSLTVYISPEYILRLVGYLRLDRIEHRYDNQLFHFDFDGVNGEDIKVVPDPYAEDITELANKKYSEEPKRMKIDSKKITVPNTPKIINNISFTRDRKITF
jgi:hypothetical protein